MIAPPARRHPAAEQGGSAYLTITPKRQSREKDVHFGPIAHASAPPRAPAVAFQWVEARLTGKHPSFVRGEFG